MGQLAIDESSWQYQAEECEKVCESFEYFLNDYCYIEDKIAKKPILFKLWPEQAKIITKLLTALLLIILKARQLGLTWLCAAYAIWYCMTKPMKLVVVISAKGEWAVEFMERVYFILNFLPDWIYPPTIKDTSEVLRFQHRNGVTSTIKSLTTTEAGAQSKTPDILILDETCWNPYIRSIYKASKPGIDAAGGRIIVISNSIKNAPGWGWTREKFTDSMKKLNSFVRIFMNWRSRPDRPNNFKEIQLQEGFDEEDFIQEYPETEEEAISAATGSYFGKTLTRHDKFINDNNISGITGYLKKNREKEFEFIQEDKGVIELWRWPYFQCKDWDGYFWRNRYAMGSDVSEGLGQSYSVAYVMDRLLDELVCRARSNRLDAVQWAKVLYDLGHWYCNGIDEEGGSEDALNCVERTGAGQTTVKELSKMKGSNQYVRIISGKIGSGLTKELGWHESEQSKYILCDDLKAWFRTTNGGFYCPILIDEASTTIKHEGIKKIGPEDSTKLWDCVVAAGCTIQASQFLEGPPKKIKRADTGWLKRLQDEGKSNWVK